MTMIIALYDHHQKLPFGHKPDQPKEMFDPKRHGQKLVNGIFARTTWIWPILMGLRAIKLPGIMAHVSAFCLCKERGRGWHFCDRVWVQITTLPTETNCCGIPLTVRPDGTVTVEHLWGGDNGTANPYQLIGGSMEGSDTAVFWRDFFLQELRTVKEAAVEKARAAQTEVARLSKIIPD